MSERSRVQHLMPLMREYGTLERRRLGEGIDPLEYQRWLDLKRQIGRNFGRGAGGAGGVSEDRNRPTRLRVVYKSREALLAAIVENIRPAGFFVPTPFAADVGTRFLLRIRLENEGETADVPAVVVTSIVESAHTLSTMSMGMGVKIDKPTKSQRAAIGRFFRGVFDRELGLDD